MVNRVRGLGVLNWGGLPWVQLRIEGLRVVHWADSRFKSETQGLNWVIVTSTSLKQLTEKVGFVCMSLQEAAGRQYGPKQLQMYV